MKKCIFAVFVCAVTTVLILSGCVFSKNPSPTPAGNADNSSASQQTSSAAESTDKTVSEENSQPEQAVINRPTDNRPDTAGSNAELTAPTGKQGEFFYYCFALLSDTQKNYYNKILSAAQGIQRMPIKMAAAGEDEKFYDNISAAFGAVAADHPELFWLDGEFTMRSGSISGVTVTLSYIYNNDSDIYSKRAELETAVSKIIASAQNRSCFEKEVFFHDFLCKNVVYNNTQTTTDEDYTVYGALVKGTAVCEGYAEAFQLLLNKCGINCITVRGLGDGAPHMWNMLELDGDWYGTDITWDGAGNNISYKFFNITDEKMSQRHTAFDQTDTRTADFTMPDGMNFNFLLPECKANYYNADQKRY